MKVNKSVTAFCQSAGLLVVGLVGGTVIKNSPLAGCLAAINLASFYILGESSKSKPDWKVKIIQG